MPSFVAGLFQEENHFIQALRAIQDFSPVVLYGANRMAKRIYLYMQKYAIPVDFVVVDKEFWQEREYFFGKQVLLLEDLPQDKKYHYIVAFIPEDRQSVDSKLAATALTISLYDVGYGIAEDNEAIPFYPETFLRDNERQLELVASSLEDDLSRESLRCFMNQKLSGQLGIYASVFRKNQYFPDDVVTLPPDCVFVDCGAFTGDTVQAFCDKLTRDARASYAHIYAIEPDRNIFSILQEKMAGMEKCTLLNKGVWDKKDLLHFSLKTGESTICTHGECTIEVDTLDNILAGSPVSFIKMDVEGAEVAALQGAQRSIQRHKPILAISLYHKKEDILTIPLYIKSVEPGYKLFIRAHAPLVALELVLYAIPPDAQ